MSDSSILDGSCLSAQTSLPGDQLTAPLRQHVLDLVDFLLPAHQLWHVKQLVEAGDAAETTSVTPPRHQAAPFHPLTPP